MALAADLQFEARRTLVMTMMDVSSFATIAKKMKTEISNFHPDTKSFSYSFLGIVAFTLLLQAFIAVLLLLSYRYEVKKNFETSLTLSDWLTIGILVVILLNSIILAFEREGPPETSFFRGQY